MREHRLSLGACTLLPVCLATNILAVQTTHLEISADLWAPFIDGAQQGIAIQSDTPTIVALGHEGHAVFILFHVALWHSWIAEHQDWHAAAAGATVMTRDGGIDAGFIHGDPLVGLNTHNASKRKWGCRRASREFRVPPYAVSQDFLPFLHN